MAIGFDLDARATVGHAVPLLDGLAAQPTGAFPFAPTYGRFALSKTGTLAYVPTVPETSRPLVLVEPAVAGGSRVMAIDSEPVSGHVRVSPDGERLAFFSQGTESDVWVHDFERRTRTRLSVTPDELDETPVWSPDGRFIVFVTATRGGNRINRVPADGSAPPEPLAEFGGNHVHIADWSPDGEWLLIEDNGDIWILNADESADPRPFIDTRFREKTARVSPDGRYVAYVSDESGRDEVYVQRFPELGNKRPISTGGGTEPIWSRDGRHLFYRSDTQVMRVPVLGDAAVDFAAAEPVFEDTFRRGSTTFSYDVMPDGRFLMLARDEDDASSRVHIVVNWVEELEARVPR